MATGNSNQQDNPIVVVTPGSKASVFLKPSDRFISGEVKPITNAGSSKISDIEFKFPGNEDDGDSGVVSDKPNLSDIEIVLPPTGIYKDGKLYWQYNVYIKNTSAIPQSVEWVDAQFGEL